MIPHRRIMLACMADNPGADVAALRREFICRVLAEHPLVACRILGQYATKLHQRVVTEASVRAAQSEREWLAAGNDDALFQLVIAEQISGPRKYILGGLYKGQT